LQRRHNALAGLARTLELASPRLALAARSQALAGLVQRLSAASRREHDRARARLELAARALTTVSPLATLGRGYAIVHTASGGLARSSADAPVGSTIRATLADGVLVAVVTEALTGESGRRAGD
jgi:exodeoxyribonuclease VII large subunit